uniref:Uncharacterized protein n=1 Tax=Anguilla anguilla TaxID=7936 RepID=A0A0E9SYP3_ANGAN
MAVCTGKMQVFVSYTFIQFASNRTILDSRTCVCYSLGGYPATTYLNSYVANCHPATV